MNRFKVNGTTLTEVAIKKNQIDEEQPKTVDEHFELIMADNTPINSEHFEITPNDLPDWFDERLFKIGQKYYTRNVLGISSAQLAGLFAVLLIPSINLLLLATNQSTTPCSAFRRYIQTLLHMYNWHIHDYTDSESKFYKSLNTVRWKHSMSSKCMLKKVNLAITHQKMALTQFGFIGYVLCSADVMGLTNDPDEREGYNHFWRVLGKLLGIPDRLNVCRKNEKETTELCRRIKDEVYVKYLQEPDDNFYLLSSSALSGLQCVDVLLDMNSFLAFFSDINGCKNTREMGLYSKWNYLYRKFLFSMMRVPLIGTVVRNFWNFYFYGMFWIQERFPFVAWIKYGKNQSIIKLYSPLKDK